MRGIRPQAFTCTDGAMQPGMSSRFASFVLCVFMNTVHGLPPSFLVSGFPVTHFVSPSSGHHSLSDSISSS